MNQKLENDKPFMNTIVSRVTVESWAYYFIIVPSFFIISCTDSTSDGARQDWTCSNSCGKICPKDNEVLIDGGVFAAVFLVQGLQDQSIWWTAEAWELQGPVKHCKKLFKVRKQMWLSRVKTVHVCLICCFAFFTPECCFRCSVLFFQRKTDCWSRQSWFQAQKGAPEHAERTL